MADDNQDEQQPKSMFSTLNEMAQHHKEEKAAKKAKEANQ